MTAGSVDPRWVEPEDWEAAARERLDRAAFDYFAGGAGAERTVARNLAAWSEVEFVPRVLVDVRKRDLATSSLGQKLDAPIVVAPTAFHGLAHPEGERASVVGAGMARTIFVNSSLSTTPVEEVCALATAPVWFQLYLYDDDGLNDAVMDRAFAAGCRALVVTVDAPYLGRRPRDERNAFHLPGHLRAENLVPHGFGDVPGDGPGSSLARWFQARLKRDFGWGALERLQRRAPLPLVLKGVLHPEDVRLAAEAGIPAVVVSNHGGRQLDGAIATARALPAAVEAAAGRLEVHVDGGVRRGIDVLRALAMGARAVWVGRPVLWGLAAAGAEGVATVLRRLRDELDLSCALAGVTDIRTISDGLLAPATSTL